MFSFMAFSLVSLGDIDTLVWPLYGCQKPLDGAGARLLWHDTSRRADGDAEAPEPYVWYNIVIKAHLPCDRWAFEILDEDYLPRMGRSKLACIVGSG